MLEVRQVVTCDSVSVCNEIVASQIELLEDFILIALLLLVAMIVMSLLYFERWSDG